MNTKIMKTTGQLSLNLQTAIDSVSINECDQIIKEIDKRAASAIEAVRTVQAKEYMLMFKKMLLPFNLKNHQLYVSRLGCWGCLAARRKGYDKPIYKMRIDFIRQFSGNSSQLRDVLRKIDQMLTDESWVGSIGDDVIFTGENYEHN